jgi:ATP-dependent Clp protease ATP-binding subunit ClpA
MMPEGERKSLIDVHEVEDIVAKIARIPAKSVSSNDQDKLKSLEKNLKMLVFGQDEAISALSSAIKLSRAFSLIITFPAQR